MDRNEPRVLGGASGWVEIEVDDDFSAPPSPESLAAVEKNREIIGRAARQRGRLEPERTSFD